jgi:hypothetical protein
MSEHQNMHDGCPNVDYQKLPLETGADNLSLHDAKVKLKELVENGFPEDPSEAEISCMVLHVSATSLANCPDPKRSEHLYSFSGRALQLTLSHGEIVSGRAGVDQRLRQFL